MDNMGFGVPIAAAREWAGRFDYEDYLGEDDEYAWFISLPEWAYDQNAGYFYVDEETGAVYGVSVNPSINGEMFLFGYIAGSEP